MKIGMDKECFRLDIDEEFKTICRMLNQEFDIAPVLYGSFGLQKILQVNLSPNDIDLLIPEKYLKDDWVNFKKILEIINYELIDLHEHEFIKKNLKVMFAEDSILLKDLGVDVRNLVLLEKEDIRYKIPSIDIFLKAYKFSYNDGYRRKKNSGKDLEKIEAIKEFMRI